MAKQSYPRTDFEARRKYANAFNSTLLNIWSDRIKHFDAIDSARLINSLAATKFKMDEDASVFEFSQEFIEYGIYVDAGTGKETPKGADPALFASGKRRVKKPWFAPKYFRSVVRLKEFLAESFALQAVHVFTSGLNDKDLRASVR